MIVTKTGESQTAIHSAHAENTVPQEAPIPPSWGVKRRFWLLPLILVGAAVPLFFGWKLLMGDGAGSHEALVFYTVRKGTLPITVTERGNLESQNTEEVICEVENFGGDRSGVSGTQILYIVPNGAEVKKGDLLVELDSAPLKELLDTQFLSLQRAEAEMIQANSVYENQKTQNETNLKEAELQVKLAEIDVKSYDNEEGGTFQIELQNIDMEIQTARAAQLIAESDKDAIEELRKLGYKSKGDFEAAKLDLLQANSRLASQMARSRQLQLYDYEKQKLVLQGALDTAKRSLDQVRLNNESELAQAEAAKDSANRAYEKEKERYERYQEQLDKCKIYAPQSGMVAYAMENGRRGSSSVIEEGAFVRQRQQILTIPDLSSMQVNTAVHESVLDKVQKGLKATVRVDAFPELRLTGTVDTVAVLPDQGGWLSSDTKVYKTIVTIDDETVQLKPGMTAVVEIDIETLYDVLSVPIQAIVQRGRMNWCYVKVDGKIQRRDVKLGETNDKFVEVKDGLQEGDIVVLNPMSLVEEDSNAQKKEKEGDEAAEGEEARPPFGDKAEQEPSDGMTAERKFPGAGKGPGSQRKQMPGGGRGGFDFSAAGKKGPATGDGRGSFQRPGGDPEKRGNFDRSKAGGGQGGFQRPGGDSQGRANFNRDKAGRKASSEE